MSPTTMAEPHAGSDRGSAALKSRFSSVLAGTVFVSLLCLIALTAIPYGTSQPWWIAAFVCVIFILAIFWLGEGSLNHSWFGESWIVAAPLVALAFLSLLQTLNLRNGSGQPGAIAFEPWNTISADPYQTRFVALQLLAMAIAVILLSRYAISAKRMRITINVVICVAVASAVFGILRQTMQHTDGFGLPLLQLGLGYGQFINKNHFAFLMEMSLGLILGLILGGGVRRDQALIYFAALLPIWIGLVLSSSRGGLIAMLAQIIIAALLVSVVARKKSSTEPQSKLFKFARSLPVRAALILVLILGVVFGTLWLGGDHLATNIEASRLEFNPDPENLRLGVSRNEIWKATWRMFMAHPILGVGMGGYWAAIPAFHNASGTMTPQEAHNDYLELLASSGVVGLALALWFAVIVFKRTRENLHAPNRFRRAACFGAAIGIAGVAIHSLVDFGLHTITNALVFTTLVVIATSKPAWGNERTKIYE
jgi:O-antigen ligase